MKKKVLLTGWKGFVGSNLLKIYKKKFNVVKLEKNIHLKKTFKKNFFNKKKLKFKSYDILIHCSYYTPNSYHSAEKQYKLNKIMRKNLNDLIVEYKIQTLIFMSSMSVYNTSKSKLVSEKTKLNKNTIYARSKINDERNLFRLFKKKNDLKKVLILRLPGVVGKGSKNNFISNLSKAIKKSKEFKINNIKFRFNNIIHVETLSRFIKYYIDNNSNGFNVVNLGSVGAMPIDNIVSFLISKLDKNYNKIIIRKSDKNPFRINFNKARKTGFIPNSVVNELKKYIKDLKK